MWKPFSLLDIMHLVGEAHLMAGVYKECQTRIVQSHNGFEKVDLHVGSDQPLTCR